jgi:hypothetical protein
MVAALGEAAVEEGVEVVFSSVSALSLVDALAALDDEAELPDEPSASAAHAVAISAVAVMKPESTARFFVAGANFELFLAWKLISATVSLLQQGIWDRRATWLEAERLESPPEDHEATVATEITRPGPPLEDDALQEREA